MIITAVVVCVVVVVPTALLFLRLPAPSIGQAAAAAAAGPAPGTPVLGLRPNTAMLFLAMAPFLYCCIPMAMPTAHLVALCTDEGMTPETLGAFILSMLLGLAFLSRQFWGWVADSNWSGGSGQCYSAPPRKPSPSLVYTRWSPTNRGCSRPRRSMAWVSPASIPAYVLAIRDLCRHRARPAGAFYDHAAVRHVRHGGG